MSLLPPAPQVHLSGGIGLATFLGASASGAGGTLGFGLTGGVGLEFADLWLLDFAVTYGNIDLFGNMVLARVGISILSH